MQNMGDVAKMRVDEILAKSRSLIKKINQLRISYTINPMLFDSVVNALEEIRTLTTDQVVLQEIRRLQDQLNDDVLQALISNFEDKES